MELYLVRHGETVWNREGKYYGHSDIELAPEGLFQARILGKYFKQIEFDSIIASPLKRAVNTAKELVSEDFEKKLHLEPRLMEQNFGLFEGMTYMQLKKHYPKELSLWNEDWRDYCLPQGESFHFVRKRVEDFTNELWKTEKEKKQHKVLITAHKGTFGHMLAALLHMPLDGYWNFVFEQGSYSRIDLEDGYAIIRCLNAAPEQLIIQQERKHGFI